MIGSNLAEQKEVITQAEKEEEQVAWITANKKKKFDRIYHHLQDNDFKREVLFKPNIQNELQEKTRSNTSKIVLWLIAIPLIIDGLIGLIFVVGKILGEI